MPVCVHRLPHLPADTRDKLSREEDVKTVDEKLVGLCDEFDPTFQVVSALLNHKSERHRSGSRLTPLLFTPSLTLESGTSGLPLERRQDRIGDVGVGVDGLDVVVVVDRLEHAQDPLGLAVVGNGHHGGGFQREVD
jgi:hypothetical protein